MDRLYTLLAVVMQSVRTAGQKQIAGSISIQATTLVRFLFGLPFAVVYFLFLKSAYPLEVIDLDTAFFRSASLAAVSQIFATVFLVKALTLRNFAVGTALAKTEAILRSNPDSHYRCLVLLGDTEFRCLSGGGCWRARGAGRE